MPETGMVDKGTILKAPNPVLLPKTPSPTNSIIETSSALLASVSSALLLRSNSVSSRRLSLAFPDLRALLLTPTSPIDPSSMLSSPVPAAGITSQFACLNLFEEPDGFVDTGFDVVGTGTVPILNSSFRSSSGAGTPDLRHSLTDSLTTEGGGGGGGRLKYLDGAATSSSSSSRCLNDFLGDVTFMDEQDLTDDESDGGGNDRQIICMAAAEAVELHDLLISKRSLSSLGKCFTSDGMRLVEDRDRETAAVGLFGDEDEFELYV
ncbi:hypothetical protein HDU78_008719 [Chytriomyces hyalinus]|nr:hypothetical protein HDU78_008719 [Chytriomyces hyalinus]